jgi:hypothetical protein
VNCYDCALKDTTAPAVAVCDRCGCGVCLRHAHVVGLLMERAPGSGPSVGRRLARRVTCPSCHEAEAFDHVRCAG